MTTTCPNGHVSASADYCDQCGARLQEAVTPTPLAEPSIATAADPCPSCGAPRTGGEKFCETCGHDLSRSDSREQVGSPASPPASVWEAVLSADRDYFERVAAREIAFPAAAPSRTVALDQAEVRIGRRHEAGGIQPEIDLAEPPEDPAVSHRHAVLVRQDDGSYAVVDAGSTNGTTLNDAAEPIAAGTPVALADGDRIHVGAWTSITVRIAGGQRPD
jgi:hypothetical protein